MSFQEVGTGFVRQYYEFFSKNRAQLAGVYRPTSLMTWVGEQLQGGDNIMARFASLSFNEAIFKTEDIDCHPSLSGGVLVVVNGEVLLKDERHPLKFNDVFHLASDGGQWYISNQIFRIVGGGGQ
ncbi:Nuclear transport factor 2 (NTF2) domain [Trypanosoma vivax]|uniref:Nuclear transport factor 2 n=1 Tax=Trypanosoma vivax (strain Y486) TaxID=1055687 RepID=G0U103_TRYVY|nr:nuclear transport factor 2 [Trypanosoma vivax]KAH8607942.1 Nuclear transport factor 2 (NTF2) domain [Trypanosoma vivax]CCC49758.1 putative nuclear transport factor 2 [Trypanosoma vivax Y486]